VKESAEEGDVASAEEPGGDPVDIAIRVEQPSEEAMGAEATKGYGLLFISPEPASEGDTFHDQITRSAVEFGGPFAIAIARGINRKNMLGIQLKILAPVTGTPVSRQGAELAIALAQASQGTVTALQWPADREGFAPGSVTSGQDSRQHPVLRPSSARSSGSEIIMVSR
jgi:hypothetical protein